MVVQENFWGRQEELFRVKEGEIFGESYSCARTAVLPVSVVTEGPCEVLFLQYQRMIDRAVQEAAGAVRPGLRGSSKLPCRSDRDVLTAPGGHEFAPPGVFASIDA